MRFYDLPFLEFYYILAFVWVVSKINFVVTKSKFGGEIKISLLTYILLLKSKRYFGNFGKEF